MRNRGNQKLLGPGALSDPGGNHSVSRVSPSGDTQIPIWQRPSLVDAAVAPGESKASPANPLCTPLGASAGSGSLSSSIPIKLGQDSMPVGSGMLRQ